MYQVRSANEVKKELGIKEAKHLGYVIHSDEKEEFLASYQSDEFCHYYAWARTPDHALIFESVRKAIDIAVQKEGLFVCYLFDAGSKYAIAPVERI